MLHYEIPYIDYTNIVIVNDVFKLYRLRVLQQFVAPLCLRTYYVKNAMSNYLLIVDISLY